MTPALVIRRAAPDDAAALAALHRVVHDLHVAARPEFFRDPTAREVTARFASLLADSHLAWLAEVDGVPSAYVLARFHARPEDTLLRARSWCEIDEIAVRVDARRTGLARALVREVLAESRRRGVTQIELQCWAFNAEAHAAFERLSFVPRITRYELTREDLTAPVPAVESPPRAY